MTEDPSAAIADPSASAEAAGLVWVADDRPGIAREAYRGGWRYTGPDGRIVRDAATLQRIAALAIPPAYADVWIAPEPHAHLQATGRDARGRKQYRYHADFRAAREADKFAHMLEFVRALPATRAAIALDMGRAGLPREKVLATIVHLLETTLIRVGNADYARTNKSFGLTTLRDRHVSIEGADLKFRFKGKSGKEWDLRLRDRRIAKVVKAAQDIPGQHLFQYLDDAGERRPVTSGDVNAYLAEIAGPGITAKDFRTWGGTVLAAVALAGGAAPTKAAVTAAIRQVAARLGNTPAICRKCYVHPAVVAAHLEGALALDLGETAADAVAGGLRAEEAAVLAWLEARLAA